MFFLEVRVRPGGTAIMIYADLVDAICSLLTNVTVAARLAFVTFDV